MDIQEKIANLEKQMKRAAKKHGYSSVQWRTLRDKWVALKDQLEG